MRKDGWIGGGAVRVGWGSSGEGEQGFFYTGEQGFKMAAFHCILLSRFACGFEATFKAVVKTPRTMTGEAIDEWGLSK